MAHLKQNQVSLSPIAWCFHSFQIIANLSEFLLNKVGTVVLHGARIVSLVIDSRERLCLAQISNSLLKVKKSKAFQKKVFCQISFLRSSLFFIITTQKFLVAGVFLQRDPQPASGAGHHLCPMHPRPA